MVFITPEMLLDCYSEITSSICCMHVQILILQVVGTCCDTARSTYGNVTLMNTVVISWYALCTDMAETIALAKLAVKVNNLREIVFDLQCRQVEPSYIDSTIVWMDNTATLTVVNCNDFTMKQLGMLL